MGADGGSGVSERVVNQLLTELDGLESRKDVYVIAATNRLELIDDAMLRPGRLGKLLYVPLPSASDRGSILKAVSRRISVSPEVNFDAIGADPRAEGMYVCIIFYCSVAFVMRFAMLCRFQWR
jgi:ribosome biogenesis ATPase